MCQWHNACVVLHVFFTSDIASTADLQEIICSGFDLSCCCVSLTVDEMLHVNLRYHCDADIHLPKMQTTLLPCAFGAPSNCIHIQLERIFKYYKRGFRFLEAPAGIEHSWPSVAWTSKIPRNRSIEIAQGAASLA